MPGMPRPPPMLRKVNLGLPGICFSRYGAIVRIQMSVPPATGNGMMTSIVFSWHPLQNEFLSHTVLVLFSQACGKETLASLDRRLVIPAHAGIQVCSRRISLDTRFRGYDGIPTHTLFSKEDAKRTKVFVGCACAPIFTCVRAWTLFSVILYFLLKLFRISIFEFRIWLPIQAAVINS
jgi:hypothetical protein